MWSVAVIAVLLFFLSTSFVARFDVTSALLGPAWDGDVSAEVHKSHRTNGFTCSWGVCPRTVDGHCVGIHISSQRVALISPYPLQTAPTPGIRPHCRGGI